MSINPKRIGIQIAEHRKRRQMTQKELGAALNISFQAVSKWERGEALPDTAILIPLAKILETSVDNILLGGERSINYKGKLSAKDMAEGINCLERVGYLLGKNNPIYRYAIDGINEKMNNDTESMFRDEYLRECLILEAIIQNLIMGYYFDPRDVRNVFTHDKWYNLFIDYAKSYEPQSLPQNTEAPQDILSSPNDIIIRKMDEEDLPQLLILNEQFNGKNATTQTRMREIFHEQTNEHVIVAEYKEDLIGFCCAQIIHSICYEKPSADIKELFVHHHFRRRGVGRRLLAGMETELLKDGAEDFYLTTDDEDSENHAFYNAQGYHADDELLFHKNIQMRFV